MGRNKAEESSFDVIREHLFDEKGAGIMLNDVQQNMCDRWNTVLELKSYEMLNDRAIVEKLIEMYGISKFTAYKDIGNAEAMFGFSQPLNKRYRMWARINHLEGKVKDLWEISEYDAALKAEKLLQEYYVQYPEAKTPQRPQKLTFIYNGNKPLLENDNSTIEDAEAILIEAANNG